MAGYSDWLSSVFCDGFRWMFWRWVSVQRIRRCERGRLRAVSIAATALLTGAAVAYAGIIAFIGPDYSSPVAHDFGPSNRVLLPASALGGALLIALSDLVRVRWCLLLICRGLVFLRLWWAARFFVLLRRSLGQGGGAS